MVIHRELYEVDGTGSHAYLRASAGKLLKKYSRLKIIIFSISTN